MRPTEPPSTCPTPTACPYVGAMARTDQMLSQHAEALLQHTAALTANTEAINQMRVELARMETETRERQAAAAATGSMARWLIQVVVGALLAIGGWFAGRLGKH